jgi:RNA polymerase sigma-70 factor (ECF subfamily)
MFASFRELLPEQPRPPRLRAAPAPKAPRRPAPGALSAWNWTPARYRDGSVPAGFDFEYALGFSARALQRYALVLTSDAARADELYAATVTRLFLKQGLFTPQAGKDQYACFRSWAGTVMMHLRENERRREKKYSTTSLDEFMESGKLYAAQVTQPNQEAGLQLRDLTRLLARLPAEQREALLLIGLDGLNYEEAADALGIPVGTVRSRLSRGREALRAMSEGELAEAS